MKKYLLFLTILLSLTSCSEVARKIGGVFSKEASEEALDEGAKKTLKQTGKEVGEESAKDMSVLMVKEGKDALELLAKEHPELHAIIEKVSQSRFTKAFSLDDYVVKKLENGSIVLEHKGAPNWRIVMNGNTIKAKGGAVQGAKNTGLNEFLNYPLPNKTYVIDDYMTYKTDEFGRIAESISIFDGDKTIARKRITVNSEGSNGVPRRKISEIGGKDGEDDFGHLVQMDEGGPNELINQVPMGSKTNRSGIWREIENYERKMTQQEGKKIVSIRKPLYKGNSRRPYAFKVLITVDGKPAEIAGKQCPFLVENV